MSTLAQETQPARCLSCRSEIQVPDTFADGDKTQCGTCGSAVRELGELVMERRARSADKSGY